MMSTSEFGQGCDLSTITLMFSSAGQVKGGRLLNDEYSAFVVTSALEELVEFIQEGVSSNDMDPKCKLGQLQPFSCVAAE
ncbi:hypothetical protein NDU88_002443 [Pleurodeles waltl]|uniref:Uncharacterized protein n=1 Tax=Pleurodeles waltl TaxID=8319 RepID=A0AAV7Q9D0_PLEWA|nr:hypothetical protein NDU88_002443 [Pleurodeles waltl]